MYTDSYNCVTNTETRQKNCPDTDLVGGLGGKKSNTVATLAVTLACVFIILVTVATLFG